VLLQLQTYASTRFAIDSLNYFLLTAFQRWLSRREAEKAKALAGGVEVVEEEVAAAATS
jgi:hypothetical protein